MPTFDANGVSLYCEERGSGDPVVFVHGTICDHTVWKPQFEAFSTKFKTITYSRRYAYPNDRQGDVLDSTVQNNADDLDALVDGLGGGKVHLLGHSYGGFIALYFALRHPEKLRSLTLCNAAAFSLLVTEPSASAMLSFLLKSPTVALSARKLQKAVLATEKGVEGGDPSAPVRLFLPALLDGRTDLPPKPTDFEQMVTRNGRTLRETTAPYPPVTRKEVGMIRVPTLVIWGELSAPWDFKISRILAEAIAQSEKSVVPGTGHFFLLEKPPDANERILGFLRKHTAG